MKTRLQSSTVESIEQYLIAAVVTSLIIWAVYLYSLATGVEAGLHGVNKSLATSTLVLLGFVLLLGPLARMFAAFDRWLKYRKEFGVLTFFTGLTHVYLSMFPLARRGPWGFYQARPLSAYAGLSALIIMFVLLLLSNAFAEKAIGPKIWWKIQNWGARIAFALIVVHMAALRLSSWGTWFISRKSGTAALPPLSLLTILFASFVLIVRIAEFVVPKFSKHITRLAFLVLVGVTGWLFV